MKLRVIKRGYNYDRGKNNIQFDSNRQRLYVFGRGGKCGKEDETVCSLVDEFHKTMCSYKNEIEKINALYERMDKVVSQKLTRLHERFHSILDLLTNQLHDLGFDVAEITACASCPVDLENDEYPVKTRKVKVRIIKKKLM